MKVRLKRTGGVAGIPRQWEIDERALAPKKALEFRGLLKTANFFALPPQVGKIGTTRDAFCYELTIEDQGQRHTVNCVEQDAPKTLCDCLEWVSKNSSEISRSPRRPRNDKSFGGLV